MGFSKELTLPTGTVVSYWRINAIEVDLEANFTKARVGGYVSKVDALLKKSPHTSLNYIFRGFQNPIAVNTEPNSWKPSIENKIKGADIDENETDLERAQRLSLDGNPSTLRGSTIVSDLPD